MKSKFLCGVSIAVFASISHADLFRVTMSGQVSSVSDTRTSGDDIFDGTAWDVDSYSPSVGDAWSYEVIYDTDIASSYMDSQTAIYDAHFASSITLDGRTISGFNSITNFFSGTVEIFGGRNLMGTKGFNVLAFFARDDGLNDLINGGMLPTSGSFFDGLDLTNFQITDSNNFMVNTDPNSPITVTVEQIPSPGSMAVIGFGGLLVTRRRR